MNQNSDKELIADIFKTAKMGMYASEIVLSKVKGHPIQRDIESQQQVYSDTARLAEKKLLKTHLPPEETNPMQKAVLWGSIQMDTITDQSPCHIAEIMMNGSTMGVVEMTKRLHEHPEASSDTQAFARDFILKEEKNIEHLKKYL